MRGSTIERAEAAGEEGHSGYSMRTARRGFGDEILARGLKRAAVVAVFATTALQGEPYEVGSHHPHSIQLVQPLQRPDHVHGFHGAGAD